MNNPQDMDKQMDVMQEIMLKMHEQMHKIMNTKNPQARAAHAGYEGRGMMGGDVNSDTGAGK